MLEVDPGGVSAGEADPGGAGAVAADPVGDRLEMVRYMIPSLGKGINHAHSRSLVIFSPTKHPLNNREYKCI